MSKVVRQFEVIKILFFETLAWVKKKKKKKTIEQLCFFVARETTQNLFLLLVVSKGETIISVKKKQGTMLCSESLSLQELQPMLQIIFIAVLF